MQVMIIAILMLISEFDNHYDHKDSLEACLLPRVDHLS